MAGDLPHVPGGERMEWSLFPPCVPSPGMLLAVSKLSEGAEIVTRFGGVSHLCENKRG